MGETQPVDNRPEWLVKNQAVKENPRAKVVVDEIEYDYTVVKSGLAGDELPYTVGYPNNQALFISEDVPAEDRPYILGHEIRHKTIFKDRPVSEACLAALEAELVDVKKETPERFASYIDGRKSFFEALTKYYEKHPQGVTVEFQQGIKASLNHLNQF